jgi:hypothetical protein
MRLSADAVALAATTIKWKSDSLDTDVAGRSGAEIYCDTVISAYLFEIRRERSQVDSWGLSAAVAALGKMVFSFPRNTAVSQEEIVEAVLRAYIGSLGGANPALHPPAEKLSF